MTAPRRPRISVILPTYERAALLSRCLDSLTAQELGHGEYEVVVVDDGSRDPTREACRAFEGRLPLRYVHQAHGGISVAKNRGIREARGDLLLFFDDDDVACRRLLGQHVAGHEAHPEEATAILGYTTWHPELEVSWLMSYVTDRGYFLSCYPVLRHGQVLDFTFFWGGRTSCKRALLDRVGLFEPRFRFGSEDVELGYRLSREGLQVRFDRGAKSYTIRSIDFEGFCGRCERQGESMYWFSRLHPDPVVQSYCLRDCAEEAWTLVEPDLDRHVERVRRLESHLEASDGEARRALGAALDEEYWWTFTGHRIRGILAAMRADRGAPRPVSHSGLDSAQREVLRRLRAGAEGG